MQGEVAFTIINALSILQQSQWPQQAPPPGLQSGSRPGAVIVPALHQGEEISIAQWTTSPPPTSTTASTSIPLPLQPQPPSPEGQRHLKRPLRPQNNISSSSSNAGGRKRRASGRPRTPTGLALLGEGSPVSGSKKSRLAPPPHQSGGVKKVKWRDLERPAPTPPPVPPPPPPPHLHPLSIRSEEVCSLAIYHLTSHLFQNVIPTQQLNKSTGCPCRSRTWVGGWVDLDFGCSSICPFLLGLMTYRQRGQSNWARLVEHPNQNQPNPLRDLLGHPVKSNKSKKYLH